MEHVRTILNWVLFNVRLSSCTATCRRSFMGERNSYQDSLLVPRIKKNYVSYVACVIKSVVFVVSSVFIFPITNPV